MIYCPPLLEYKHHNFERRDQDETEDMDRF